MKLSREEDDLYQKSRVVEWQPLDPPVQRGWKRFFVLRDDVSRGRYAAFFEGILAKINTYDWHYRKDFKVKKRFRGRKKYVVKPQKLKELRGREFDKMGFTDTEKLFFDIEYRQDCRSQTPEPYYVFKEPWRFVLRVRPNIIDKVRVRNWIIETRMKEIKNYFGRRAYRGRLMHLKHGFHPWRWKVEDERGRDPYKNKPVRRIVEETKEEVYKE